MTRGRRIAFTVITVTVPFVFALVLLEAGLRGRRPAVAPQDARELQERLRKSSREEVKVITTGNLKGLVVPSTLPDVIYELKPDHRWIFQGGFTQTNHEGMRSPEVARTKPAGTLRVAGMGDSVMFGWGVDQNVTYLSRLEASLAALLPGQRIEVLNFAVPGYNSMQEAALLEGKAQAFSPDIVLVGYVLNDWAAPFFLPNEGTGGIIEKSELFRLLSERLGRNAEKEYAGQGHDKAMAAIERMGKETRTRGQRAVLFVFPQPADGDTIDQIRQTAVGAGFVYVDMYKPFADHLKERGLKGIEDLFVKPVDPHPNPEGHELIARVLAPVIAEALSHPTR
ncbi:MAG: SGNH/GDSL hydrolase family protein [Vicinamibacteria bacterium]